MPTLHQVVIAAYAVPLGGLTVWVLAGIPAATVELVRDLRREASHRREEP